jgi:tetratricopeptide (TPR) repeat protein
MERTDKKATTRAAAYDQYLKGLCTAWRGTYEGQQEAIRHFEEAMKKDPSFSLPYSATGNLYVMMGGTYLPFKEIYPKAKELIARALEIDPKSSDAHMARGNFAIQCELDWKKAETELQHAIQLNPGNVEARAWYGVLLELLQRFDEAKAEFREVIRLNPLFTPAWNFLAMEEYYSGDLYATTSIAEYLLTREPVSFTTRLQLAYCYALEGRTLDALKEIELLPVPPDLAGRVGRATVLALVGKPEEATLLVKELEERKKTVYIPGSYLAELYATLGQKEKALDVLEHEFREGDKCFWLHYQSPPFVALRSEPRFVSLLKGYKLPKLEEKAPFVPHVMEGVKQPAGVPT